MFLLEESANPTSPFQSFLKSARPVLPIPILLGLLPLIWLVFRKWWKELDEEAQESRAAILARGRPDARPLVALVLAALILTMHEYYGGRSYFDHTVRPLLQKWEVFLRLARYEELYGFAWWSGTRVFGYLLPFAIWKLVFREDSLLDMGFRVRGLLRHAWIYLGLLLVVVPPQLLVSFQPDFATYYPFYKASSRSWWDFLLWEGMYFFQFFALEAFFRGWWLGALRKSLGAASVLVMAVPYCMIHYGKPYLETNGAIVAGIVLGSIAMKTRSIWGGVFVHVFVAGLMDFLCLRNRHALPTVFWPPPL